jgi:hypothetical protein
VWSVTELSARLIQPDLSRPPMRLHIIHAATLAVVLFAVAVTGLIA